MYFNKLLWGKCPVNTLHQRRHLASHSRSHSYAQTAHKSPRLHKEWPPPSDFHVHCYFLLFAALLSNSVCLNTVVCMVGFFFFVKCLSFKSRLIPFLSFPSLQLICWRNWIICHIGFPESQFCWLQPYNIVYHYALSSVLPANWWLNLEALSDSGLTGWRWGDCFANDVVFFLKKHLVSRWLFLCY